ARARLEPGVNRAFTEISPQRDRRAPVPGVLERGRKPHARMPGGAHEPVRAGVRTVGMPGIEREQAQPLELDGAAAARELAGDPDRKTFVAPARRIVDRLEPDRRELWRARHMIDDPAAKQLAIRHPRHRAGEALRPQLAPP